MGRSQRTIIGFVCAVLVVAWLIVLPHHYGKTNTVLWAQALYIGAAAMGLNLLTGYNGQVSIGHGAFFGLGAYTSALLIQQHGWQFLPTLLVAAPLCFVVGVLIGFPALRVKGLYLALVTLGLAVLFPDLTKHYVHVTGGTNLVSLDQQHLFPPAWVPTSVSAIGRDDQWAYYVTLGCALVLFVVVIGIVRSRFGRALIAVRDHEAAAQTAGINIASVKVLAFALSALYAGVAGSCSVLIVTNASADKIGTFQLSIQFLVAVVIGGTATVLGPMIGGWLVVFVQHWISTTLPNHVSSTGTVGRVVANPASSPAIFGILLILFVFALPDGLVGGARRLWSTGRARLRSRTPPSPAPAAPLAS
ncbi:MAG TPA: branched-chain amino acid ABC transporter permease [Acidimicrobiia bacterium]|nr:branched-chain amino acid ABC transporter permease [Acidimicrobiia bacterium]